MDADLKVYLDDRFRGIESRLDRVERTLDQVKELLGAPRDIKQVKGRPTDTIPIIRGAKRDKE